MIQVHVVRRENRHLYADLLDRHFQLRHDIFVEELGWIDMNPAGGRERDQFDTDTTTYFLITDGSELIGAVRMHPSEGPTLMSEIFPRLASVQGLQRGPDIVELTRGWVVRSRRDERPCRASGAWKVAVLEYCLSEGIRYITSVAETWFMPRIMALGWQPRFLGLPETIGAFNLVAFKAEASQRALDATRRFYGFDGPVAIWNGVRRHSRTPAEMPGRRARAR